MAMRGFFVVILTLTISFYNNLISIQLYEFLSLEIIRRNASNLLNAMNLASSIQKSSQIPVIFIIKCKGFMIQLLINSLQINHFNYQEKFANDSSIFHSSASCENRPSHIAFFLGAKLHIFRKSTKVFHEKVQLRR